MNASSNPKYFTSLSLEEPTQHPNLKQQSWLLTYVDVFILIIMLMITLMAISDFKPKIDPQETKKQFKKIITPAPQIQNSLEVKPEKNPASLVTPTTQAVIPKEPVIKKTDTVPEQDPQIIIQDKEQPKSIPPSKQKELPTSQPNEDLQKKFKESLSELGLIDSVQMQITLGYAQIEIQDKILFNSSDAKLVDSGESLLKKLSILLKQSKGLIYIEGHTDNRPIKTMRFPSNWELGAARATSVLHYLASQKLDVTRLRAVTYGATKPLADNSTKEGRERNRRVSLAIKIADNID